MKTNKMIRCLVSVLLVCALLFSWSPVKAEASTSAMVATAFAVSAFIVVASILNSEAIHPGSNYDGFKAIVDGLVGALELAGLAVDGMIDVYKSGDLTYVDADLPQFVKDWVWSHGAVLETIGGPASFFAEQSITYSGYSITPHSDVLGFGIFNGSTLNLVLVSSSPFSAYRNSSASDTAASVTPGGNYYIVASKASKTNLDSLNVPILSGYLSDWGSYEALVDTFFAGGISSLQSSVSTDYDLTLGDVAGQDEDLATGYPEWAGQSVALTPSGTDTVITGYPVSTPATYEEAITQTQTEAQQGTTSITDDQIVIEGLDGTLAETQAKTFVDAIGDTVTNALSAIFVPSEGFLTDQLDYMRGEYGFADSIASTAEAIFTGISAFDTSPPVIYIDLSAASGDIYYGEKMVLMDFAWYEPYKPSVDALLSAALWTFFVWRVFMKLPGIIGGESGYWEEYQHRGKTDDKKHSGKKGD